MSFFNKFKSGVSAFEKSANSSGLKKDPNAPQLTLLEKHIADIVGPPRADGSDKFFGFENYGSTCYSNSIIQCLYYSAPFRENVTSFPYKTLPDDASQDRATIARPSPKQTSETPYPNPTSPARKQITLMSPGSPNPRPEENKESPEYRKRMALQAGPVLSMTHDSSAQYGMAESLFTSLRDIFDSIINNNSRIGVVSPHRFLEILRNTNEMFRQAMHHDAHEFLNHLLNQIVDDAELFLKHNPSLQKSLLNGNAPKSGRARSAGDIADGMIIGTQTSQPVWVHDIFQGLLASETRCLSCHTTSQRDEPFLDLSVDLSPHMSVTACLRKFSEEEMLSERNKFHCDTCGGLQEAEKRMKIKRLPRVLALHLKRFKYTDGDYMAQRLHKLFHRVVYPFYLRLFNTTDDAEDPDRLYELYAVVVHIGGGAYHGHYVSIIKTQDRGWLLFDDELVEPVDKSYVMNFFGGEPVPGTNDPRQLACAYVLFYQETTLEAVLREEQDFDRDSSSGRASNAETANDSLGGAANGLYHFNTTVTPVVERTDMDPLTHATTTPMPFVASLGLGRSPFDHSTTPPTASARSKKELKQEEKDKKALQRAEEKAREKLESEQRKEASDKRVEARRKAEEEVKMVTELSKQTGTEEAKQLVVEAPTKEKESGLSRLKHGSIRISGGMRWRASGKRDRDDEKEKPSSLRPTNAEDSLAMLEPAEPPTRMRVPNDPQPLVSSNLDERPTHKASHRFMPFSSTGSSSKERPTASSIANTPEINSTASTASSLTPAADVLDEGASTPRSETTALPVLPPPLALSTSPEKAPTSKKNRFSLGKKKSSALT